MDASRVGLLVAPTLGHLVRSYGPVVEALLALFQHFLNRDGCSCTALELVGDSVDVMSRLDSTC